MDTRIKKDYEAPLVEVLLVDTGAIMSLSPEYEGFGSEDDLSGE